MSDIHALEILVIVLALSLALAIYVVNVYARSFKESLQRLRVLTDFMQYIDREKHLLPKDIRHNYEKCLQASLRLMKRQMGKHKA